MRYANVSLVGGIIIGTLVGFCLSVLLPETLLSEKAHRYAVITVCILIGGTLGIVNAHNKRKIPLEAVTDARSLIQRY